MLHLAPIGLIFTIGCTYSGFLLLAFSVLWNANLVNKLKEVGVRWRQLRR